MEGGKYESDQRTCSKRNGDEGQRNCNSSRTSHTGDIGADDHNNNGSSSSHSSEVAMMVQMVITTARVREPNYPACSNKIHKPQ